MSRAGWLFVPGVAVAVIVALVLGLRDRWRRGTADEPDPSDG